MGKNSSKPSSENRRPVVAGALNEIGRLAQIPACSGLVAYREQLMPIINKLTGKEEHRVTIQCDKKHVYETAMSYYKERRSKQQNQQLQKLVIVFSSDGKIEPGIDANGLRREFYSQFFKHAISGKKAIFEGNGRRLLPRNDTAIIQSESFILLGMGIVESILNGDCGFPYLQPAVYHYIFDDENYEQHLCIDDIPDPAIKELIKQILETKTDKEIVNLISGKEVFDFIGWPKGKIINLQNRDAIAQQFLRWNLIGSRFEALDQLREGFKFLGFLEHMKRQPLIRHLFIYSEDYSVTAAYLQTHLLPLIRKLQVKNEAEKTAKTFAEKAIAHLNDGQAKDLYEFITNLMDPPVFQESLAVTFNTQNPRNNLPDANVCASNLIIPLGNKTLEDFEKSFELAIAHAHTSVYGQI